uniref:L-dopachrome isomerase n=1 Tax=Timema cristinae TaxID=61476 RepID=A0A7R9DHV1_TIMCR|nr:unnamed protein product [Timema cristinae]
MTLPGRSAARDVWYYSLTDNVLVAFIMPLFRLETNVPRSKITPEFLDLTTAVMAKTLGRGKEYCMAEVIPDVLLSWKGSSAPAGNAMLLCIGLMGPEDNQRHAAVLSEHLFNHLGIPKDRLLIEFNDIKDSDVGFNGTTVDALGLFKK